MPLRVEGLHAPRGETRPIPRVVIPHLGSQNFRMIVNAVITSSNWTGPDIGALRTHILLEQQVKLQHDPARMLNHFEGACVPVRQH